MKIMIKITLILLSIFTFSACSFLDLKEDLDKQSKLVKITGTIKHKENHDANMIVALIKINNSYPSVVNYRVLKNKSKFSFIAEPGLYRVMAYLDSNANVKYEEDELLVSSKAINLKIGEINVDLVLDSLASKSLSKEVKQIKQSGTKDLRQSHLTLGNIVSLDSKMFSEENVKKGLWQPYEFVSTVEFGLFFLEEYNPDKKIILFIHGINGNPRNFKYIIDNLDHSKFQAMILYYPSGLSISMIADYTKDTVKILQAQYKFDKISVVAHSMGGLTSRRYLNLLAEDDDDLVDTFISISTPWSGHAAANSGLKYSPLIIPVWRDMATGSDFIADLFKTPLNSTKHYLLFGYKGSSSTADGNSDGVVSIKSELRAEAQVGATFVRGFNENHNDILNSKDVSKLVNKLLEKEL